MLAYLWRQLILPVGPLFLKKGLTNEITNFIFKAKQNNVQTSHF